MLEADLQRVEMGSLGKGKFCLVDFSGPAGPYKKVPTWPEWGWGEQGSWGSRGFFKVTITMRTASEYTYEKSSQVGAGAPEVGQGQQASSKVPESGSERGSPGSRAVEGTQIGPLEDLGAIQRG